MPDEITQTKDGHAAIYARTPAWHHKGTVKADLFTAATALKEAGLDYGVMTAPGFFEVDGQKVMSDAMHTYRYLDDGSIVELGTVGKDYVPVDPKELFIFMDDVVQNVDGAHYTAAFALRNWTQVVCVADTGDLNLDPNGRADTIKRYIVGRTSHDGSLAFGLKWSNMRVECANMLAMHLRENAVEWKTKHTTNIRDRVATAKVTLGLYHSYGEEWATKAESFIEAEITDGDFERFLSGLMTAQQKATKDDEIDRSTMYTIRALYESSPTNAGIRGTVWGALNAATEFSDWVVDSRGSDKMDAKDARILRQIGDTQAKYGQAFKQLAWESANELQAKIADTDKKRNAQVKVGRKTAAAV